jgi:hypothetical protein
LNPFPVHLCIKPTAHHKRIQPNRTTIFGWLGFGKTSHAGDIFSSLSLFHVYGEYAAARRIDHEDTFPVCFSFNTPLLP